MIGSSITKSLSIPASSVQYLHDPLQHKGGNQRVELLSSARALYYKSDDASHQVFSRPWYSYHFQVQTLTLLQSMVLTNSEAHSQNHTEEQKRHIQRTRYNLDLWTMHVPKNPG
jgi:hypothetical protein